MSLGERKADIKKYHPDAKIIHPDPKKKYFEVVAVEFERTIVLGFGHSKNGAWRNAFNQMN